MDILTAVASSASSTLEVFAHSMLVVAFVPKLTVSVLEVSTSLFETDILGLGRSD